MFMLEAVRRALILLAVAENRESTCEIMPSERNQFMLR